MIFLKKIINIIFRGIIRREVNDILKGNSVSYSFSDVDIQVGCVISSDSSIGAYTYVGMNTTITKTTIGRYCSIANNVSIGDGEHILDEISTSSYFYDNPYDLLTKKECVIGNDVWIATKSIIRRGVKIGDGAVVGANSFVNKDVPPYAIVAGSPARIIKYRFNNDIINIISKANWWNMSFEDAKREVVRLKREISIIK